MNIPYQSSGVIIVLSHLSYVGLVWCFSAFFGSLIPWRGAKTVSLISLTVSVILFFSLVLNDIIYKEDFYHGYRFIFFFFGIIFVAVLIYSMFLLIRFFPPEEENRLRKVHLFFIMAIIVYVPAYLLDFHGEPQNYIISIHYCLFFFSAVTAGVFRFLVTEEEAASDSINTARLEELKLTERETDVLKQLLEGLSYREIAEKEFISLATVKTHVIHIYKKARVKSRHELFITLK